KNSAAVPTISCPRFGMPKGRQGTEKSEKPPHKRSRVETRMARSIAARASRSPGSPLNHRARTQLTYNHRLKGGEPMAERAPGVIAPGLFLRGELRGEDDLIIEGRVEGEITLKKHLTVETTGVIVADVKTQNITIKGEMRGNMTADDKVEIHQSARV